MSKIKTKGSSLTAWFPETVKPVHVGVYRTEFDHGMQSHGYSHWNGRSWGNQFTTPKKARTRNGVGVQDKRWHGLTTRGGV